MGKLYRETKRDLGENQYTSNRVGNNFPPKPTAERIASSRVRRSLSVSDTCPNLNKHRLLARAGVGQYTVPKGNNFPSPPRACGCGAPMANNLPTGSITSSRIWGANNLLPKNRRAHRRAVQRLRPSNPPPHRAKSGRSSLAPTLYTSGKWPGLNQRYEGDLVAFWTLV